MADKGRYKVLHSERFKDGGIDIVEPDQPPAHIYADGWNSVAIVGTMVNVEFYQLADAYDDHGTPVEQRQVVLRLTMSADGFYRMCASALASAKSNEKNLLSAFDASKEQVKQSLSTASKLPVER